MSSMMFGGQAGWLGTEKGPPKGLGVQGLESLVLGLGVRVYGLKI